MPHPNPEKEAKWEAQPKQKKARAARNRARRQMEQKGLVHKGDGKEVDHKKFLGGKHGKVDKATTAPSNLRVISREANRKKQPKRK
jgi:hypothetical protein